MSFSEFITMGNHGFYVWSCYGAALIIFAGLYFSVNLQHKKIIEQLHRRYRRQQLKQQQRGSDNSISSDQSIATENVAGAENK